MNKDFLKIQTNFLIQLLVASILVFAVQSYLMYHFANEIYLFFPVWQIYTFHFITTALLYGLINYKYSKGKTEAFMIGTLLKMILAIVFLLPLLLSEVPNKKPDVVNFFFLYFLFLAFEVVSITKFLQKEA